MLSIRKIGVISRTYRHLNRYRQILAVFFRYGFGDLVDLLNIEQYIEVGLQMISRNRGERIDRLSRAERVRMAFEELGPTYIKLGQILSTRPDLVPDDFVREFERLQDDVAPIAFGEVRQTVEKELRAPLDSIFESFDEKPIAAASIGQVHKAALAGGDMVAVKVQRPGIRKTIEIDLEIMLHLATLMERHVEEMALFRPIKIVEEFARTLEKEVDYTAEAQNLQRIAKLFLNDRTVYIPSHYPDFSSSRVLVTELIEGICARDLNGLDAAGMDRKVITERGATIVLKQIFDHGFFHADPHPGNILVLPRNVICLLDFGMVGIVDRRTREDLVDLIDGVVNRDTGAVSRVMLKLTTWEEEPEIKGLEKDISDYIGRHFYSALKEVEIGRMLRDLIHLVSRHRLGLPPDIYLMIKALATVEGLGLMLDPEFDMITRAAPFLKRIKLARLDPDRVMADLMRVGGELAHFSRQFPNDLLEIARQLRRRRLLFRIEHEGMSSMLATHDQISNRISFSIIIAALIIGSALIVISATPPLFYGISLIGIILFIAAAVMGIWLLVAILKKGRL
jgi:ubiquinone biosynthesis protein